MLVIQAMATRPTLRFCSIVNKIDTFDLLTKIEHGTNPLAELKPSLRELAFHFNEATRKDETLGWVILSEVEKYYQNTLLKDEIRSFNDFFKLAALFDRDQNSINRFFDSILGLYSPASETKLIQIAKEKKDLEEKQSMRVRGSFEYSHTQTHYSILMDLFNYLSPESGESFIDIGSGFGRVGLFIGLCFPDLKYQGYELVEERVNCADTVRLRNQFKNIDFKTQDLLDPSFEIPSADYYFLYDPLEKEDLKNFYLKLKSKPSHKIIAFEGYDDFILEHLNSCPWLREVKRFQSEYFKQTGAIYESK
ncbi:MAG: precorrin-6B methylase 2 [Bacteriovoracaceae bacterium]|jgi:precorrin-6B methylase 2